LLEAILHAPYALGHEVETMTIENCFLNTSDETEAQVLGAFTDFAQEIQVEDQFLVFARAQIIKQFVHDE